MSVTECGIQAFQWNMEAVVPRILIAVDSSSNLDAVQQKALEVFDRYSRKGPVCITLFGSSSEWIHVETSEQLENLFDQDYISPFKNKWSPLFSRIAQVYSSYSQQAKVIIISDMKDTKTALKKEIQRLTQTPPNQPLKLQFCQIGTSESALAPSETPNIYKTRITHEVFID